MTETEPSWDLYRTFLGVMREGSLSGAARALGLTQPTVGRHVDALELTMGYALFIRTQQGLSPTQEALALQEEMAKQTGAVFADVEHRFGDTWEFAKGQWLADGHGFTNSYCHGDGFTHGDGDPQPGPVGGTRIRQLLHRRTHSA